MLAWAAPAVAKNDRVMLRGTVRVKHADVFRKNLAEYADVRHTPIAGGNTADNHAFYVQMAYRLPGAARQFKPYARTEKLVTSSTNLAPSAHASTRTTTSHAYDATASAVERILAAAARRREPTAAARKEAAT